MGKFGRNHSASPPRAKLCGPGPAPRHLAEVARPFAERAAIKLKNFRTDLEMIQHSVMDAMRDGVVTSRDAELIFLDIGNVVSTPLIERYFEAWEYELVARWLTAQAVFAGPGWIDERIRIAVDGMIAGGEQAMAIALLRKYLRVLHKQTRAKWRDAGARPPKGLSPDGLAAFETRKAQALHDLPGYLAIAEQEIAEIEPWVQKHGSREDNRALEKFGSEIARVRERFAHE